MNYKFKITRVKRQPYFVMDKSHYHIENEIYYLLSGTRRFFINDTIYTMSKGDLAIIFKGNIHRTGYVNGDTHERINMMFSDDVIKEVFAEFGEDNILKAFENPIVSVPSARQEYVEELFVKIYNENMHRDEYSELAIKSYIQELFLFLLRYRKYKNVVEVKQDLNDEAIQEAAKYISNNFDKPLTLEAVATHVNMSHTYFSKKFKESTGFGFKEYVINVRLKEASHRLLETKDSITDVAMSCGFSDSNYFGDVFKRVKGMAPSQYRKNNEFI